MIIPYGFAGSDQETLIDVVLMVFALTFCGSCGTKDIKKSRIYTLKERQITTHKMATAFIL